MKLLRFLPILFVALMLSCSDDDNSTNPSKTKTYDSVKIGTQYWMKKNLDVERYRNGDPIPQVKHPSEWAKLTTGAWCYYDNDPDNNGKYGKLYNWYAVNDPRGLAPEGWKIATDDDWKKLELFKGVSPATIHLTGWRSDKAGGALKAAGIKEQGTGLWYSPNVGANSSDFFALPGGYRIPIGNFNSLGYYAIFWTATNMNDANALIRQLNFDSGAIMRNGMTKNHALSVRCVK